MSDVQTLGFVLMFMGLAISVRPPGVSSFRVFAYLGGVFEGAGLVLVLS